ncbi:hypothetical protein [Marixanthomonas ophiurae]|uniref:RHS repeat protein n=1 Tax=Marixanthomonas ophiurae TaxID=387659 RepID=A0A3E1Q7X0_9FLAO|nr:hypothetical protein [Marixanthomonas ophiurae]RFN58210.1 hypothetical protein DZ858_13340 [Marixanthomonas ophiurae]
MNFYNYIKDLDISGTVKSIKKISYEGILEDNALIKAKRKIDTLDFSESSRIISPHFNIVENRDYFFIFDKNNNIIETHLFNEKSELEEIRKRKYNHDLMVEEQFYKNKTLLKTINYDYDTNKHITSKSYFDSENVLVKKEEFSYYNGQYLKQHVSKVSKKEVEIIERCRYDIEGNIMQKVSQHHKINFEYDLSGNLIEMLKENIKDNGSYRSNFKFDSKNRIIEEVSYSVHSSGEPFQKSIKKHIYNNDDLIILTEFRLINYGKNTVGALQRGDGISSDTTSYMHFIYNTNKEVISYERLNENGSILSLKSKTYNHSGILIEEREYSPDAKIFNSYNENGDKIICRKLDRGNREVQYNQYSYLYDKKNNWIKRVFTKKNNPNYIYIIEREIEYYD